MNHLLPKLKKPDADKYWPPDGIPPTCTQSCFRNCAPVGGINVWTIIKAKIPQDPHWDDRKGPQAQWALRVLNQIWWFDMFGCLTLNPFFGKRYNRTTFDHTVVSYDKTLGSNISFWSAVYDECLAAGAPEPGSIEFVPQTTKGLDRLAAILYGSP